MEMSLVCPLCLWMGGHVVKVYNRDTVTESYLM